VHYVSNHGSDKDAGDFMGATLKQSGDTRIILLEGDLTLPHAPEIRTAFMKALVEADDVLIRFGNVRELDLSCLQLLCSAHRSAARLKKRVRFEGDVPRKLSDAADTAGYSHLKGCKLDTENSCLWIAAAGANHG
jgi:anti-anti-sigma regulatory factor